MFNNILMQCYLGYKIKISKQNRCLKMPFNSIKLRFLQICNFTEDASFYTILNLEASWFKV